MTLEVRVVFRHLGLLMLVLSGFILATGAFVVADRLLGHSGTQGETLATVLSAVIGAVFGVILFLVGKRGTDLIGQREAMLLVALSWFAGAGLAALPFRLWAVFRPDATDVAHDFDHYVNCYFEAMSGLTTTGATITQSLATLPRGVLLWRALTQWLGGLGIVVLFVAVLPQLGVGSRRVYRIEAAGPSPESVTPRIQDTTRILWIIYLGLTVVEAVALRLCGMGWFDSICHTMTTLATGGFGTRDASTGAYPTHGVQIVLIVFMLLAGVNFGLYQQVTRGRWRALVANHELRAYLLIIVLATVIVTISLQDTSGSASFSQNLRNGLFHVVSIQTTTGFGSADFDRWGFSAKATLIILMFVGGCAGSTGGGIKVVRLLIGLKVIIAELEHVYRPKVVRTVKVGDTSIEPEMRLNTLVYILSIVGLFAIGTIALMLFEAGQGIDIATAASATAATLNNVGPGLARVGPTQNFAWFSDGAKILMSVLMALGRLEVFTVAVLLTPRFWRGE